MFVSVAEWKYRFEVLLNATLMVKFKNNGACGCIIGHPFSSQGFEIGFHDTLVPCNNINCLY